MDDHLQTIKAQRTERTQAPRSDAVLVHIYPTGPAIGSRHLLGEQNRVIGRGDVCDICIEDSSVSRRHASIEPNEGGYCVRDLGSTNGTFLNDQAVESATLSDGDYLRVGQVIYRFLMGGNLEAEYHEEIYRLMIIDALTEINNKRYLIEALERELARTLRYRRPLAVVMFDIDHFKKINDEWGHLAGDSILRELATRVKSVIRKDELFARYGGEEFSLVLPETPIEEARELAERVRAVVANTPFHFEDELHSITISLGIACTVGQGLRTVDGLLQAADDALYRAKETGRNRVCVHAIAPQPESPMRTPSAQFDPGGKTPG